MDNIPNQDIQEEPIPTPIPEKTEEEKLFDEYLAWVYITEPSLHFKEDAVPKRANQRATKDYSMPVLKDMFDEALYRCKTLQGHLQPFMYKRLIFWFALHLAIFRSRVEVDKADNATAIQALFEDKNMTPLQQLFMKYKVYTYTHGILNAFATSSSSGATLTPYSLASGDLSSSYLLSTPYGREVESIFEALGGHLGVLV